MGHCPQPRCLMGDLANATEGNAPKSGQASFRVRDRP
jgi:hypothetical protein